MDSSTRKHREHDRLVGDWDGWYVSCYAVRHVEYNQYKWYCLSAHGCEYFSEPAEQCQPGINYFRADRQPNDGCGHDREPELYYCTDLPDQPGYFRCREGQCDRGVRRWRDKFKLWFRLPRHWHRDWW